MSGNNLKKILYFCLNVFFTFTNSVDTDEMQHYAAFHLGLHCLQKYSFRGFPEYKGLNNDLTHCMLGNFSCFYVVCYFFFHNQLFRKILSEIPT